jgi:hypothetical protein
MIREKKYVLDLDSDFGDPIFLIGFTLGIRKAKYSQEGLLKLYQEMSHAGDYFNLLRIVDRELHTFVNFESNDPLILANVCVAEGIVVDKTIESV